MTTHHFHLPWEPSEVNSTGLKTTEICKEVGLLVFNNFMYTYLIYINGLYFKIQLI